MKHTRFGNRVLLILFVAIFALHAASHADTTPASTEDQAEEKAADSNKAPAPEATDKSDFYGAAVYYAPLVTQLEPLSPQDIAEMTPQPPPPASTPKVPIGLRYKLLLLDRNDDVSEVTEKHPFHSGDQIRFVFEANHDGYLYIYLKGASGRGQRLFPNAHINNGSNSVRAYRRVAVPPVTGPSKGWWRFDKTVGEEEIYLFFSLEPLEDLASLAPSEEAFLDDAGWQVVTTYGRREGADRDVKVYYEPSYMSDAGNPDDPPSAYVVSGSPVLVHHLTLKHRR